jgi:hypothetical protein
MDIGPVKWQPFYIRQLANTACNRPAQLRELDVIFNGWRSGAWRAVDAEGVMLPKFPYNWN